MERRKLTAADIDKVRGIEGFPIGSDEDIIALSDAPFYTACPNPFIEEFIRENGTPYDEATDDYHREPFAADVSEGKADPIYNAYSYHTKVPHKAIMRYLLHYTNPGDIVLDGFCGSGMTGVAAQLCGANNLPYQAELEKTIAYLRAVLADEKMVLGIIREEILAIKAKYADERRTQISVMDGEIDPEDLIQEDSVVVTLTHFGYVKRIPRTTYRSQNRGGKGIMGMTTREEDYAEQLLVTSTHDEIMFFTNRGRVYSLKGYEIPEAGRTARGTAIVNLLQLIGGEKVTAMIPLPRQSEGKYLTMATRFGLIKKTALDEFANLRKAGLIAIVLREDDELIGVELTGDDDELMLATRQGQAIRFKETDIRAMGRNSMGVKSFDLSENDEVISVARIEEGKQVLAITQKGYGKRTDVSEFRVQSRGGKGIMAMRLTERTGLMAAQLLVHEDEDIMLITDDGTIIRMPVSDISTIGRVSQGVRVMRVEEGSHIVCVTATERDEDEEEASEADGETMEPTEENSLDMDLGGENSENQPEETEE